jgi:hypothetical protein
MNPCFLMTDQRAGRAEDRDRHCGLGRRTSRCCFGGSLLGWSTVGLALSWALVARGAGLPDEAILKIREALPEAPVVVPQQPRRLCQRGVPDDGGEDRCVYDGDSA